MERVTSALDLLVQRTIRSAEKSRANFNGLLPVHLRLKMSHLRLNA